MPSVRKRSTDFFKGKLDKVTKAFLKKQNNEKHHAARDAEMETDVNLQKDYSKSKSVTEVFTADPGECGQGFKRFTGMKGFLRPRYEVRMYPLFPIGFSCL